MVVVADSTPLIYLSRVGVQDVLVTLFGEVLIPRAVHEEVIQKRPSARGVEALRQATWPRRRRRPATRAGAVPTLRPILDALVAEGSGVQLDRPIDVATRELLIVKTPMREPTLNSTEKVP